MRIAVGADHRGVSQKENVKKIITALGHEAEDMGPFTEDSVDYPDFAEKVGKAVVSGKFDFGILICDTGIGMSIAANKVKGIRAGLCGDAFAAERARLHNDANVLCMSGRLSEEGMRDIIARFLATAFEGGRHQKRVEKIALLEKGQ
jgi:ribose 5-phosphate isomerase B